MLQTILIIVGALLGAGLLCGIIFTFIVAYIVYSKTLMRGKSGSWGREHCSEPGCIPLETMWVRGLEWQKGEKNIVILPGRRETLVYSYYYANPYKECGVNVLVIDQRAHGLSEGKYSTCGIKEAEDVSLWMKYMHDELGQKELLLHGVCVGTCVTTLVSTKYKVNYLKAVILDSAFITYKEIYKNHYIESGHSLFPVYYEIWAWFSFFTHCNINDSSPLKYIDRLDLPVLFMWGDKDIYCLPEKSKELFAKCGSKNKQLEWFEGAEHSRVRLYDEDRYDALVRDFLARVA